MLNKNKKAQWVIEYRKSVHHLYLVAKIGSQKHNSLAPQRNNPYAFFNLHPKQHSYELSTLHDTCIDRPMLHSFAYIDMLL